MDGILLKKHLWDFDGAEVSRAASGAWDRLPIVPVERGEALLATLRRRGLRLYGAIARARRVIDEVDLATPVVLAIGGEKRGLSRAVRERCDRFVRIPIRDARAPQGLAPSPRDPAPPPGTTPPPGDPPPPSLPLGHAAILLAEAARQRRADRGLGEGEHPA